MTNYFISYDISDDRLRDKTAKLLLRLGCKRVQKSVFFAPNYSPGELGQLKAQLEALLLGEAGPDDSVLCIPIIKKYLDGVVWIGENNNYEQALEKVRKWLI